MTRGAPGGRAGVKDLFSLVVERRALVVAVVVLSLVSAAVSLAQPVLVGQVIDRVGRSQPYEAAAWGLGALVVVGGVLSGLQQYLVQRTAEGAIRSLRRRLVAHLLRLPVAVFDRSRAGDLVSRVSNDATAVRNMLSQGFVESAAGVFTLVGAMVAMVLVDPVLVLVAVVVSVAAVGAVVTVTQRIERASLGLQEAVGALSASVDRAVRAVRTIRAANAEDVETRRVQQDVEEAWRVGLAVARVTAVIAPVSSIAMQGSFLAVLGLGGLRVASGALSVAELVQFVLFLFLFIMPLGQLLGTVGAVGEALGGLRRINDVLGLRTEERPEDHRGPVGRPHGGPPAVDFDGVVFRYPVELSGADGADPDQPVLDGISFRVEPGQRVAVVGPSGGGKSTLLSLLVRFYDVSAGAIRVDGVDVREVPPSSVRSVTGYVEQDSPALAGTLRDNLVLGCPGASDAACLEVLEAVNLTDVVGRSPQGLGAPIGETGVLLSGGERQRLAIARALLSRPSLLLLDESTSHLDGLNETRLRLCLERAAERCTTIVVAHRLSTVVDCDAILVLDEGRLVASGTHDELLERSPLYRALAESQLAGAAT